MSNRVETISELLCAIRDIGLKQIEPMHDIKHGPTIGEMYEGLTQEIVEKAIFNGLDLRVVSGKIVNNSGVYSDQIDCMIVVGEGKAIPYTDKYIYPIDKVIMVIEVKSALYSSELSDALDNLFSVVKLKEDNWHICSKYGVRDAFRLLAAKDLPDSKKYEKLSIRDKMLYHVLVQEDDLPLRVIIGYSGFVGVNGLRFALKKQIEKRIEEKKGNECGPAFIPNLIIAKNSALVKTNGMPYCTSIRESDEIGWISSYERSSMLVFLELLWTRLCYRFDIASSELFGDEIQIEALSLLLSLNATDKGWEYCYRDPGCMNNVLGSEDTDWEPVKLSKEEFVLMQQLCSEGLVLKSDLVKALGSIEKTEQMLSRLEFYRLIYLEDGAIKLLTKEYMGMIDPVLGYLGGDNYDKRFSLWLSRRIPQ